MPIHQIHRIEEGANKMYYEFRSAGGEVPNPDGVGILNNIHSLIA